ncbi:MAG: tol-pal system protein YbgF [Deltaproteobacteria bacterium]|jgi:tol-pal system protein YbgF|nr:tol-pal system protein YbgF [Deltaproteobacteria bacterium]MDA8306992.1 tol-pal system protein YbgF [Deltaproteobacteria bacterium]
MKTMRGAIKERVLWYCVVVVFAGLLAGCASTSETSSLQENLAILNQREAALEKRVQNQQGTARRTGDLYAQMQQLEAQIRSLNGKIDDVQHQVNQIQQNQASSAQPQPQSQSQSQQSATPPVVVEPGSPGSQPPMAPPPASSAPSPGAEAYPPPASRTRPAAVTGRNAEQVEFNTGVQLLQRRNYEAAKGVFQRFLSTYPHSGLGEDALYYIGECSFGERHYEAAIKDFQAVVDRYPKGGKTASALLKEAMGWQKIGENTMARIIYTRIETSYPGTAQARVAQKKLNQM